MSSRNQSTWWVYRGWREARSIIRPLRRWRNWSESGISAGRPRPDRGIEIPGRRGAAQRVVPPFAKVVAKSALGHGGDQQVAHAPLLGTDGRAGGVALAIEAVVAGPHVDAVVGRALRGRTGARPVGHGRVESRSRRRRCLDQRQIDGRAGGMGGEAGDVAEREQAVLLQLRIKPPGGAIV